MSSRDSKQGVARQFPPAFSVYKEGWSSKHYFLGHPGSQSAYAVSLHTGWSGKPDIILHNGPTENDPPLATSNKITFSRGAVVTLPPLSGSAPGASEERIETDGAFGRPVLSFSVEVGDGGRRERFEWRHSSGNEVRALGGRSDGWKLVRIAKDAPPGGARPGAPSGGGGAMSSDGREVVAVWAASNRRINKGFHFRFLGTGANGSLGERWATMTVISALRGWDRVKRAQSSSNSAGAGAGAGS